MTCSRVWRAEDVVMAWAGAIRLIGLDPGLQRTGWGVIDVDGNVLRHVASGVVASSRAAPLAHRLLELFDGIVDIVVTYRPDEAAIEETFVNRNPASTLKLGHARAAVMLAPAQSGLDVAEYSANHVKKTLVGNGHAAKRQVQAMVRVLLPTAGSQQADAADALAVAICHAHNRSTRKVVREAAGAGP